jgi:tricorn protease-like protein
VTRITNDLSNYRRLTLSRDGKVLAALQTRRDADLWVAPVGVTEQAHVVAENMYGINSVAWMPDSRIVFSAFGGGWRNIWIVDSDGGNLRQITFGPSDKEEVAVTPDGKYILYTSLGGIWRIDPGGTNAVQLTRGFYDVHPTPWPDSGSVLYASFREWSPAIWGKATLWRVPIDGGQPVRITEDAVSFPRVSPDGSKIAVAYFPDANPEQSATPMAIFRSSGGSPLEVFDGAWLSGASISWTSDGRALMYGVRAHGVGNLWRRPLPQGQPVAVTNFPTGDLFAHAASTDSKRVALIRGKEKSDVVLITGFR